MINRKDNTSMQRQRYIEEAHMARTYSALQYLFYLYSVSLGDALTTAAVRPFLTTSQTLNHPSSSAMSYNKCTESIAF